MSNMQELTKIETGKILGLFANSHLDYVRDRKEDIPSLTQLLERALDLLDDDEDGFFLMIEGARIDHAGHANHIANLIYETLEFDEAVDLALEFQKRNPETLLIVTADHGTGGPTLAKRRGKYPTKQDLELIVTQDAPFTAWASRDHTSIPVVLFGIGPGAKNLSGMKDNTELHRIMLEALR